MADRTPWGVVIDHDTCLVAWSGCRESYTGAHYCDRSRRHDGRHLCVCGATKVRRKIQRDSGAGS